MFNSETVANIRVAVFSLTAGICVIYTILALALGRPDPIPWWIPSAFGAAAALILVLSSGLAGAKQASMAWDEGYSVDNSRAAGWAFWVGVWLYPIVGGLVAMGFIDFPVAFAVVGLLTSGTYLSLIVVFDLRGRS